MSTLFHKNEYWMTRITFPMIIYLRPCDTVEEGAIHLHTITKILFLKENKKQFHIEYKAQIMK